MQLLKPVYLFLGFMLVVMVAGCAGLTAIAEPTQANPPNEAPLEPTAPPAASPTVVYQTPDWCVEPEIHPIAQRIADDFEVSYEQVITWYCEENEFEDILLALETNELSGVPVELLLEMRANDMSWEQIWRELGLID